MKYTFLDTNGLTIETIWSWAKKLVTDLNSRTSQSGQGGVPSGAQVFWLSNTAPDGWLICDGTLYLISDYPELFVQIGQTYGGTDNEFAVPDLRNRMLMGAGATVALNAQAGAAQATLSIANMPAHNHDVIDPGHTHLFTGNPHSHSVNDPGHKHSGGVTATGTTIVAGTDPSGSADTGSSVTGVSINPSIATGTNASATTGVTTQNKGGGSAFSVLNPVFGVNVIIKA